MAPPSSDWPASTTSSLPTGLPWCPKVRCRSWSARRPMPCRWAMSSTSRPRARACRRKSRSSPTRSARSTPSSAMPTSWLARRRRSSKNSASVASRPSRPAPGSARRWSAWVPSGSPGPAGTGMSRRELLKLIGLTAGSAAMYQAMTSLGYAAESGYKGPIKLEGDPKGASVLILGAGLAGMVAALELRQAGYKVQVLEFNSRPGGRCWTLRGGDTYTELGGATQHCGFDPGLYLNPGPWRIPYHHHALLDYCARLKVALEPFIQVNTNAWLHSGAAFGGRPQRYRHVQADFNGCVSELLAKATSQHKLDETVTREDQEILLQALRGWGALDQNYAYKANLGTSLRRGFEKDPGGGLSGLPKPSEPLGLGDLLKSGLWQSLLSGANYEFQTTLFQPVGGMDMIAR